MAYSDFVRGEDYQSKQSGSAIEVVIINAADARDVIIGATTGINATDDFEKIAVEEAGEDGIDEIVDGRHSANLTVPGFWTPKWNDTLPTRQNFLGKEFIILERIGEDRVGAGTVLNAYVGAKLSRLGASHSARGAKTLDMAFMCTRRYNGAEWAALTGT